MRVKSVCPNCGFWHSYKAGICPICNIPMRYITLKEFNKACKAHKSRKSSSFDEYVQKYIFGHNFVPNYKELHKKYREEREQQEELERRRRANQDYDQWMSAYNSGLSQGATPEQAAHAATCRPQGASTVHIPKCPTCGSTDLTKITTGTKVAKTVAFGVVGAISDAGKTWKCNNCGSKF